jgi:hypothetical protein
VDVRRGSRASSRASDADRRHRALLRRSWDLLPIAQRDTEPAALPALTRTRQRHHLQIALSLRHGDAEAGSSSTAHPALVRGRRVGLEASAPARKGEAGVHKPDGFLTGTRGG